MRYVLTIIAILRFIGLYLLYKVTYLFPKKYSNMSIIAKPLTRFMKSKAKITKKSHRRGCRWLSFAIYAIKILNFI